MDEEVSRTTQYRILEKDVQRFPLNSAGAQSSACAGASGGFDSNSKVDRRRLTLLHLR